uniref:hypothetical protein n=1 Tax=Bartonella sp. CL42QHWL TaxID=3243528 RepID=UPI0035D0B3C7
MDSSKLDFIIQEEECNEAIFEYYLPEEISIKSISLKSISFFNSWWLFDFIPRKVKIVLGILNYDRNLIWFSGGHFSLTKLCSLLKTWINSGGFKGEAINHVKFNCNNNNYLILELTEDKEFGFDKAFDVASKSQGNITLFNKWFGFKQEKFTKKGKYYSTKPLPFYVTELFLRTNLVDTTETFFNNTPSNILSIIPVEDGDQVKL